MRRQSRLKGAGDGTRTRDNLLGRQELYQTELPPRATPAIIQHPSFGARVVCSHCTPVRPRSPPAPEAPEPTPPTAGLWLRAEQPPAGGDMGIARLDRQSTARAIVGTPPQLLIAIGAEQLLCGGTLTHWCRVPSIRKADATADWRSSRRAKGNETGPPVDGTCLALVFLPDQASHVPQRGRTFRVP